MGNQEAERAEIFDAMGHPTRITILKLLSREAVSFADLKRKMGIDSSGHLQHHLTKLDGLIKTDEHGNYRLSDTGNDALFAMQTVETTSEKRRRRPSSYDRKTRMLLSIFIVALAVCSITSALYLSNTSFNLGQYAAMTQDAAIQYANQTRDNAIQFANQTQYAANATKNQYVCDIVTGSLNDLGDLRIGRAIPIEIVPGQTFNYTAAIFSPSNPPAIGWAQTDGSSVYNIPPPKSNDIYYRQGFLKFEVIGYSNLGDTLNSLHYFPVLGPENWNELILANSFSDLPPYSTMRTRDEYSVHFSGGLPVAKEFLIPIEVYGNYTVRVENTGDFPINITYTLGTPVITMETKPLKEYAYPTWSSSYAGERIARIRQQSIPSWPPDLLVSQPPQTMQDLYTAIHDTASTTPNLVAVVIFSVVALTMLTIFTINRKRA